MSVINNSSSHTLERMPVTFSTISNNTISPTVSTITPLAKLAQMNTQPLLVAINTAIPAEISTEDIVREYDIQTNEIDSEHDDKQQQIVTAWRLLTYLLGSDISFPVPTDMAELYSASATQENKLLTLYHSDLTKALIAKVLGCSPNAVSSEVAHAFFGRLAWLDTAAITSAKAKAQLEKYLYGAQPFWDPAIQLGSDDYSELGKLLTSVPEELRWWMVQFKRGERLYLLTEWLPLASQKTLYDGFMKKTQQQSDDALSVFADIIDRQLGSVKQQYRDDVLAPALNTALASKNTAVLVMLYFNWNAVQEGATREQDLPPVDWSEPISLATRRDCYQRMATYLLNSSNAPGDEDWLSDAIEQAQQANGMQVLSLATALRQARPQLERDQALKLAALLLLPLPTQTTLIKPRPENAPDPLALMDSVPEITNLLPAAGSAAPADALLDHFGLDLICQGSGADRKLSQSARDSWQLLMQTAQFEAFSAKLLQQLNWYGGHKNEQTSVRVSQALVGRAMVDHFTGSGASQAIERNFQKNWVSEYRYAELMTKLREEIKTRNPALSHASLDILSYLLFRSIAPELLLSGVPDHLSYGRGLQSVALLHGAALLEAMSPGACQGAKFDDVVNLSAQLAANTNPEIQTLWANTRVRPALRYALAHGAISGLDDIRNATAAQITPAIHYLDAQQKLHAEALNRLNSKAPDRRALAEQQLTSAGVAREYWSSDPNPNQAELDKHHIATASEESWDRFRANIATRNNWGAGPHERGGYVPPPPVPYPPLVDLMMIGDRYVNGTDTVPTVYHRKFTAFSDTLTAAESTVIQRLLAELPAADRTLLATSTLEISRLTFGDQAAYQGIFIRCQPGDHRDDFNQHLASAQEVYFELIPAAGVARRTPQQFTYLHSRERRYIPMETMDNAVEARREHEREQIARARITPLLPFDSSAYINGTVARSAQTIPQPLNATLVPAAPLLFNTAANETATLQAIADAAAKHLLTDPIAAMKKEHNHETSWEQVFKAEKEIADFAVRTLVPFYGCIKDLAEGNDSAGVVAGCAMDTVFALIPFGQFVGSTARIVLKAGEMTVLSVAEAMGEATAKLLGGLARQSTVLAWTDMVKGARWLVKGTWQTLLEEVPSLKQLAPLMNGRLRAEGISLQGGYYHAEAAPVADGKILTGSLAHETDVLTRSTWPGKVNAVDMANNLPYGAELSTPGYAGKHIAPDFYPKKIDLQHKFYDGGFTTSITLDGSALIADRGTEIDFAVGNRVYRLTSGQTALHDLNAIRSSQADALRPVANRQSGDLSLETPLESFDDSEQLRQQAFNYRRYQPAPAAATAGGSLSQSGGLLTLDRRIYRYHAASASPLTHEQSVLRYQNTVSARVKIDPLFGKPQAFTDEVLDTGTCVIELDGINEGVADKRTLRAIIMDNPQATGKILVLEADPLIFYGAPITDANSLQNSQVLQFTRYSDNTDGGSAVIDGYLSARKAYFPADTSLLPTRAAGILELPQTRFNRYLPFPARDMQPLELDGETFYAWKKPNIMGHYELYRINPSQPTQLISANQFAVLEEGEWQHLGLKGGMPKPKKTIAALAEEKRQREAEEAVKEQQLKTQQKEYINRQPQMLLKIRKAQELYEKNPSGFYEVFVQAIQERINFFQEFFEITQKLRTTTSSTEYNRMASELIEKVVTTQRKLKELYRVALEKELLPLLALEYSQQRIDTILENRILMDSIGISNKRIELQLAEEKYLDELKILGSQGREVRRQLREKEADSSILMKTNQIPLLSRWIIKPEYFSEISIADFAEDLDSQADEIETVVCTHIDAMNDEDPLFSSARRKDVLQSVIEQYEKAEMNYQTFRNVFSPSIHTENLERILERIREAKTSAKEALSNIIDQDLPTPLVATTSANRDKVIFKTKNQGLLIGKLRKNKNVSGRRVMETFNPSSKQITKTFEEVSQDEWAPVVAQQSARPARAWKPLMKDAQEKLDNAKPFIDNALLQSKTRVLPSEVEHILVQHAERMQQRARELGEAVPEALAAEVEKVEMTKEAKVAKMIAALEDKAQDMIVEGRRIRIMMSKQQDPNIGRLSYLLDEKQVSIHKIGNRKSMEGKNSKDWLQEYEIRDETTKSPLWYAHFHYEQENSPFDNIITDKQGKPAAHLKTKEQRFVGLKVQTAQEQRGDKIIDIIRSEINLASAKRIFENIT